jgi:hypothetical protein
MGCVPGKLAKGDNYGGLKNTPYNQSLGLFVQYKKQTVAQNDGQRLS